MNKNEIIETAFEVIKTSTEWGTSEDSRAYGCWVDGVVTIVDRLIKNIDEKK